MFSRRLAIYLLGVWMGCCMLVDALALEGHRIATRILDIPIIEAKTALTKAGDAPIGPLLHHLASEQVRATLQSWESAQLVLALLMLVLLVFTDQRKILAIAATALMGLLALLQHYGVTPDLNVLGRSVDFMAESASFSTRAQIWTLTQIYGVLETAKLAVGGVLASYLFAMESTVKRSKHRRTRATDREAFTAPLK
jgi:hypothetical protein